MLKNSIIVNKQSPKYFHKPDFGLLILMVSLPCVLMACTSKSENAQQTHNVQKITDVQTVNKTTTLHNQQQNTSKNSATQPNTQSKTDTKLSNKANTRHYHSFIDWKLDFTQRAQNKGYKTEDVQKLLAKAYYNPKVLKLDSNQAEFSKMPWEYVDSATASIRVRQGRKKISANRQLFNEIEQRYKISPYIVTSIWGMESSYGSGTGSMNLVSSLATLAYNGRRQVFAEDQLTSLLFLLDRGDVSWYSLRGSWAGGMGHTQFIPETWRQQGVDGNADGRRNPWSSADALSSTASYLHNSGWIQGLSSFYEVTLPNEFNYVNVGKTKTIGQWRQLGIKMSDTQPWKKVNESTAVQLWLPAGKHGPVLLLTQNFEVIKQYNNSSSYALGVSLLAQKMAYQGGLKRSWPKYEKSLSRYQVKKLQQRLTDMGYETQGVDGVIGTNTRKAFQQWQLKNGQVADSFICQRTAKELLR